MMLRCSAINCSFRLNGNKINDSDDHSNNVEDNHGEIVQQKRALRCYGHKINIHS